MYFINKNKNLIYVAKQARCKILITKEKKKKSKKETRRKELKVEHVNQ